MIITKYSDICKEDARLRPYQQKAKREIFESWDEVDNVMFQMPTGTGKTRLFTSIISDINKYSIQRREAVKILIIAHRTELITQIGESLDRYQVGHNFIAGGMERKHKYPVYVASIQTITNAHNIKDAKKLNVQFIIIDEAHHALAASYKKLWEMYPDAKRLGVTATPWRMNHQSFTSLFNKLVLSMPIKDFIKQGFLAPYKYFSLKSDTSIQRAIDDIELDSFGEYKESSMEEKMDIGSIRAQLLDSYISLAEGRKGIIYAINRSHAKHICDEYSRAGYNVVCIDSKTPDAERRDLVKKFKKGQIDIIVNVDIFSEGFDCPDIEFIQLARPTRSLVKYLQQVGRGLRPTENKQHCVILDNVGMYSRFGLPDARRHWKYHFIGQDVDEEPKRVTHGDGNGSQRYVDLSEGTEDMELIQDDYEDVEVVTDVQNDSSSAITDFFPLFGVTLGKTTWKDAKDMGYKVEKTDDSPSRNMNVEDVDFWDHEGEGIFTSIYWTHDESDFPPLWKSKGFDWSHSFDEWMAVFKNLGYSTKVNYIKTKKNNKRDTLSAEFEALSPDGTLNFTMDFNYGENGCSTSSPKTLYSITVDYQGPSMVDTIEETDDEENVEEKGISSTAIDDFFPLFGVTLGKTTWKDAEELGAEVKIYEKGPDRNTRVNNVYFWDHEGKGVFTHIYWGHHNADFPSLWKEKGFSWDLSYEDWTALFEKLGYYITIKEKPCQKVWQGRTVLSAEFKALSSDETLSFDMSFNYGEDGYFTSSPNTLYSITVDYKGEIIEEQTTDELENSTEDKGSKYLIYNDDRTEVIGCKDDDCETIVIPEGVTAIAKDAFRNKKSIKSVSFPESLISIGSSAFKCCSGITKIELNDNLEEIGFDAFYETGLKVVEIPYNVNHIGITAFNCEMKVDSLNTDFEDIDGVLYDYDETILCIYPSLKRDKHYDVPDDVLEIKGFAFENSQLQSITLPGSIKTLSTNVFDGCANLTQLMINVEDPDEIEIDEDCFDGFEKRRCKLIVPKGCKAKYSSHPMFKDFFSIEEIKSEEEDVVEIKRPSVPIDPLKLDKIFDKKATTYKYFWFMAIISLAKEKKSLTITYKDIVIRMAAMAWPIVFEYDIDFGTGDMIPKYLNDILKQSPLTKELPSKVVEAYLNVYYESEGIGKILEPLLKNVPYRFLSPWITYTTDNEVIMKSNSDEYACLYALRDDHLILNKEWWEYIKMHYSSICRSAERSFITYVKQKNKHNNLTNFMAKGWPLV